MIIKTNIDEDTIEGLIKDVLIKRLSSEIYNRNFQNFTSKNSSEITNKINSQLKNEFKSIVEERVSKWQNNLGENIKQYIDRKILETIENIDFEKIIKEKYIK